MKKLNEFQDTSQQDPSNSEFTPLQQDDSVANDPLDQAAPPQEANNIRLSQAQKFVLAKLLLPDATPLTSYEQTSGSRNIVANRDTLEKLEMVEIAPNSATITDKGTEALKQEGLVDDMGSLTPLGEKYAFAPDLNAIGDIAAAQKDELQGMGQGQDQTSTSEPPADKQMNDMPQQLETPTGALESWSMISDMQSELSENLFMRKHGKKL